MILGYEDIVERIDRERLLENFEEENIGGAGVDLRVKTFYKLGGRAKVGKKERKLPKVEEIKSDSIALHPGEYLLVETIEKINMPDDLVGRILTRSTLFRCGASLENALVDPGFRGTLTFGIKNEGNCNLLLEKGARICQIVFERVSGKTKRYAGRYQGGKVI